MGKRKHTDFDEEEYLEEEIRRLEKKRSKMRRKQRHYSYSSSESSRSRERDYITDHWDEKPTDRDEYPWQEDAQNEVSPLGEDVIVDLVNDCEDLTNTTANVAGMRSVVMVPVASTSWAPPPTVPEAPLTLAPSAVRAPATESVPALAQAPLSAPVPASAPAHAVNTASPPEEPPAPSTSEQTVTELEPNILCLLGDEPVQEEKFGPCVHKDIACRWSDILINGLKDEVKEGIIKHLEIPENLTLAQAPLINPEIKAACVESALKRNTILAEKQKLLGKVITGVANTMSTLLTTDFNQDNRNQVLKSLSDTGRLLCHLHSSETQTRRHFILVGLNKDVKDNIKDLKRDNLLFGKDLQEGLKSMKAISRTGAELRPAISRPRLALRDRQAEPNTSRTLNWRGQPPPAVRPPPRRSQANSPARRTPHQASTSSARGGRRPPPPSRAPPRRRAPQAHNRPSRR